LPDDIDSDLELVVSRMIALYLIEVSAFHTFSWAEEVLSDATIVAGDGRAGELVSFIRQDEEPHVAWLRTALSEMRDRTWVGTSGKFHNGDLLLGQLWSQALDESVLLKRQDNLNFFMDIVVGALQTRRDGDDLLDEMLSLGTVIRLPDGTAFDTAYHSGARVDVGGLVVTHR
jgi:hypothetical protein